MRQLIGNEERLSRLVGEIYDSTLDPSLWPKVLAKIGGFVGGHSAGLISKDSVSKAGNAHYTFGCNPHYLQLYLDHYAKLDPTMALFFFAPEQVVSIATSCPTTSTSKRASIRSGRSHKVGWIGLARY